MIENGTSGKHCVFAIFVQAFVLLAVLGSAPLRAQTLDAPEGVCPGEPFEVQWTGPNGAGDRITIADPATPADQSLGSRPTADGSPSELEAPTRQGFFEIRYIAAEPESILARRGINVTQCLSSSASSGRTRAAGPDTPDGSAERRTGGIDQAVVVTGIATHYGDVVNRQGPYGNFEGTIEALCDNSGTIGWALSEMLRTVDQAMRQAGSPITFDTIESLPGAPSRADLADNLRTVRDEVCDLEEKPPEVQPFVIAYAYCRMAMITPGQVMDIHLPPAIGTGTMTAADYSEGEAIQVTLQRSFDAATAVVGSGWSSRVNMTSPASGGFRIGYPTTRYAFEYSGGLGGGMVPFADMVSTETSGSVWVSDAVPGLDIVRSFYENLTAEVSPDQGGMSFFSGLINNLVGMLRNGLPLEIDQTVSSKVMGRTSVSGRSHSIVTGVRLIDFRPEWCSESLIADNIEVRDIDQEMSAAMSQSGVSSEEMQESMRQYNEAMQQMTPEQRQMMEQFGMGDMMQQMTGGASPDPQQPGGSVAPRAASAGSGGSSMPPASELESDDLTESVQKHLQALGYDVGNTDGEASMETAIAISTFQAEKGMEVTGEVSPQLLGILSAEVDSRR